MSRINRTLYMLLFMLTLIYTVCVTEQIKASADPSAVKISFNYATEDSIAISWNKEARAKDYTVYVKSAIQYTSWKSLGKTTETSYVLENCVSNDIYSFKVAANGVAKSVVSQPLNNCCVFNTSALKLKVKRHDSDKGIVHVEATSTGQVDSFLWSYKTLAEKEYTIKSTTTPYITITVPNKAAIYEIKCNGIRKLANGTQYVTEDNSVTYVPDVAFKATHASKRKIKLTLTPVEGATGYIVQMKSKTNNTWIKVATLKATKKKYTISKYKKQPLVLYKTYYVRVKTVYNKLKSSGKNSKKIRFN